jgi:hypothetical protein
MQVSGQSPPTAYRLFWLDHSNYEDALAQMNEVFFRQLKRLF